MEEKRWQNEECPRAIHHLIYLASKMKINYRVLQDGVIFWFPVDYQECDPFVSEDEGIEYRITFSSELYEAKSAHEALLDYQEYLEQLNDAERKVNELCKNLTPLEIAVLQKRFKR